MRRVAIILAHVVRQYGGWPYCAWATNVCCGYRSRWSVSIRQLHALIADSRTTCRP